MKVLLRLAAIATCFLGLQVSKASAEFPVQDRSEKWVVDTGNGYPEAEWTYFMLLDLGLTEYEAMLLLVGNGAPDSGAIAIPNLFGNGVPDSGAIAIPNL